MIDNIAILLYTHDYVHSLLYSVKVYKFKSEQIRKDNHMNFKTVLKWTPWWLLCLLVVLSLITSLDGVVFAEIIARLSALDESVTRSQVVGFATYALTLRLFVFLAMYFNYQVKAKINQILNTRLKQNFLNNIYHSSKPINASESIAVMTTDYEVINNKYFNTIFEIFGYTLMLITSIAYILSIDFKYGFIFVVLSLLSLLPVSSSVSR